MPKALITGASSGIGEAIAKRLDSMGYETVLTARRTDRLEKLSEKLSCPTHIVTADLTDIESVKGLVKTHPDIDVLINNAGLGVYGEFTETDFLRENSMLDVNIRALHLLMKEYIPLMEKRGGGKILNVSSSAAFFSGPFLSSYYASKAYVLRLSRAVREELRRKKSPVTISVLCPGPVETEFGEVSGSNLGKKTLSPDYVAKLAVKGMMKNKFSIVPDITMKCTRFLSKILPEALSVRVLYNIQKAKKKTN